MSTKATAADAVRRRVQAPAAPGKSLPALLEEARPRLQQLAGRVLSADRLLTVTMWALRTTPQLAAADPASVLAAVEFCARVGLVPGPEGYVYLVPRWNSRRGVTEAIPIIGYRGYWALARRSGYLRHAWADAIWPQDQYRIERGTQPRLEHVPDYAHREGLPILVYSVAVLADGSATFEVMPWSEVEAIRKRSAARDAGPWVTDPIEMGKKTVVRRHAKQWDLTPEAAWGIAAADAAEYGTEADVGTWMAWPALSDATPPEAPAPSADAAPAPTEATPPPAAAPEAPASEPEPPAADAADTAPSIEDVQAAGKAARAAGVPDDALREIIRGVVGSRQPAEWSPAERRTLHERLTGLVATLQEAQP
jgi:recombination protein RecT